MRRRRSRINLWRPILAAMSLYKNTHVQRMMKNAEQNLNQIRKENSFCKTVSSSAGLSTISTGRNAWVNSKLSSQTTHFASVRKMKAPCKLEEILNQSYSPKQLKSVSDTAMRTCKQVNLHLLVSLERKVMSGFKRQSWSFSLILTLWIWKTLVIRSKKLEICLLTKQGKS